MTIQEHLQKEEITPLHQVLLDTVRDRMKQSRSEMGRYYALWDSAHKAYKAKRDTTKEDQENANRGLPRKIGLPLTYSQINSAVAYSFMLLKQKPRMFEFTPVEGADGDLRECNELLVDRDWQSSEGDTVMFQFWVDLYRFGVGVMKDVWEVTERYVPVTTEIPAPVIFGQPIGDVSYQTQIKKITTYEGNKVMHVSPFRWFPDPAVSLVDWKKGEYVAFEDEHSIHGLKLKEGKSVFGTNHLKEYKKDDAKLYGQWTQTSRFNGISWNSSKKQTTRCVTEMYITLNPKQTKEKDGNETLGEIDAPVMYLIWMANDQRIIRCEPFNTLHGQFPCSVGFFAPDEHDCEPLSLSVITSELQDISAWLFNSRIASVTRMVDGQCVVNEGFVNMQSVESRQRVIRINKNAAQRDIRSLFMPLPSTDTTTGHVQDMAVVQGLMQNSSGVNDNMMGQFNGGRRSATEAKTVTMGAASRMRLVVSLAWQAAFQPLANRLRTNLRAAISLEQFTVVCGEARANYFPQFRSTPEQLASEYDFIVFDGTSPSEKMYEAQQLESVFQMLLTSPSAPIQFNLDPKKVFNRMMELRGMSDVESLGYTPEELQQQLVLQAQQQAVMNPQPPTASDGQPQPATS